METGKSLRGYLAKLQWVLPQIHGCIASPGSPGLRDCFCFGGGYCAEAFSQGYVFFGESVRPAQGAHYDVMGGPRADAGESDKLTDRLVGVGAGVEFQASGNHLLRQSDNAAGSGLDDP